MYMYAFVFFQPGAYMMSAQLQDAPLAACRRCPSFEPVVSCHRWSRGRLHP